jgi:hypothetical protein
MELVLVIILDFFYFCFNCFLEMPYELGCMISVLPGGYSVGIRDPGFLPVFFSHKR